MLHNLAKKEPISFEVVNVLGEFSVRIIVDASFGISEEDVASWIDLHLLQQYERAALASIIMNTETMEGQLQEYCRRLPAFQEHYSRWDNQRNFKKGA